MSKHESQDTDVDVASFLEAITNTWSMGDPRVLYWPGDPNEAVVADVDDGTDDYRVYHSGLVYPGFVSVEGIAKYIDEYGEPQVTRLSVHEDRFGREMFEWEVRQ